MIISNNSITTLYSKVKNSQISFIYRLRYLRKTKNVTWAIRILVGMVIFLLYQGEFRLSIVLNPTTTSDNVFQTSTISSSTTINNNEDRISLSTPSSSKEKPIPIFEGNTQNESRAYIKRFLAVAQIEMTKFGIPTSITLAQGLIESNRGKSKLALKSNNHFGIKCFSKKCKKGHCTNFSDDHHKDFFRVYKSVWDSYRAHSTLLQGKYYKHLHKIPINNYKEWAKGLKKAGYATDPNYAYKLINIIEKYNLQSYDK